MVILKLLHVKERITISLRKKPTFEELVQENRNEILNDEAILEKIDEKIEKRWKEASKK
ncbi:FbpB family small basic protein [Aquibacillus koreensis]|uniref:FbpB family small basic protein n=1 Tax=Aquibacillus koreensis TaxID=279446 RepID=UPI002882E739|nr:FbpB family small basic protein [Aquibacillus koreensis]